MYQLIPFYLSHFTYFFLICGYLCVVKILMIFAYLCFSFFQVFSNENVLLLQLEKNVILKIQIRVNLEDKIKSQRMGVEF